MLRPVVDVELNQLQQSGGGIMATAGYVSLADLLLPRILYITAGIVEGFILLKVMLALRKSNALIPIIITGGAIRILNCTVSIRKKR